MEMHPSDPIFWICGLVILLLVLAAGHLSGTETAMKAASRTRLKAAAERGEPRAAAALALIEDSERVVGAVLLAGRILNLGAMGLAVLWLGGLWGAGWGFLASMVLVTLLVLVFGEVLPKIRAVSDPDGFAMRTTGAISRLTAIFAPVFGGARAIARFILGLFGIKADKEARILFIREEIAGAIELGLSEGAVEKEDRNRLMATLDLSDRTVEEIMKHRSEIEAVNADDPPERILAQSLSSAHTRLPVYRDDPENILGVVHAKDLLREVYRLARLEEGGGIAALDILKIARKPYFVPETTDLDEQLRQFLKGNTHFALVVDEYGALRGLITLEDIIEEIIGDISDEFDPRRAQALTPLPNGDYLVNGAMTIRDLNRAMDWSLPDAEANTIAGLLIHEAQTIPLEGQIFSFHGLRFEVVTRRENRILRVKLRRL